MYLGDDLADQDQVKLLFMCTAIIKIKNELTKLREEFSDIQNPKTIVDG